MLILCLSLFHKEHGDCIKIGYVIKWMLIIVDHFA